MLLFLCCVGVSYVQLYARIRNAQVDDMTPNSEHPVLLLPLDAANRIDHPSTEPLLHISYVAEPGRRRGVLYCPCIAARLLPLRICVGEPLIWRLMALGESLHLGGKGVVGAGGMAAGGGGGKGKEDEAASAAAASMQQVCWVPVNAVQVVIHVTACV